MGRGAEFDVIRRILGGNGAPPPDERLDRHVLVGAGDDCAVIRGEGIAISMDMSVEDVHFRRDWLEPQEIGYRAAAAALSDLAAVAAVPFGVLAAVATPPDDARDTVPEIMDGVRAAAAGVGATLLGGDLSRTDGALVVDVVVLGQALRPVLRNGARPGDSLWVTGELGAAAAAVRAWQAGRQPEAAARLAYALPTPRVAEAAWLAGRGALDALVDLSDGLAGDAGHIAAASGVRIIIDAQSVPVHATATAAAADRHDALYLGIAGGEDYELCFAAPPGAVERLRDEFDAVFDVRLTCVGSVHEGSGVVLRDFDGTLREAGVSGFDHFRAATS